MFAFYIKFYSKFYFIFFSSFFQYVHISQLLCYNYVPCIYAYIMRHPCKKLFSIFMLLTDKKDTEKILKKAANFHTFIYKWMLIFLYFFYDKLLFVKPIYIYLWIYASCMFSRASLVIEFRISLILMNNKLFWQI